MKYMNIVSISLMWMSLSIAPMSCAEKEVVNNLEALMPDNNRIIGKVHCEGKGLEGVIVTDGTNFCTTSYGGFFILDITAESEFVSIVTPSGYMADYSSGSPEFYRKVSAKTESYDFNLTRYFDSDDYNLIAVADPQAKDETQFGQFKGAPLEEIRTTCSVLADLRSTVGICLGDLVQDAMPLIPKMKGCFASTGIPFYYIIGNHDFNASLSGVQAAKDFKSEFGPLNYAFYIGQDLVIGLNSVLYTTNKKFEEGYDEETVKFLEHLLKFVPKTTKLYVAQHIPIHRWWKDSSIQNGDRVLDILDGYDVSFLTGHTHVHNITRLRNGIVDHNISGFLGAWWVVDVCRDGTPRGYEIFTNNSGMRSYSYHSVEKGDDGQYEIILPGQSERNPDAVVLNVWDVDDDWTVEWSEDGVAKGQMERTMDISYRYAVTIKSAYPDHPSRYEPNVNKHFFKAVPSQNAREVELHIKTPFGKEWKETVKL